MHNTSKIDLKLTELEKELAGLDAKRVIILDEIKKLKREKELINRSSFESSNFTDDPLQADYSSLDQKVALFRNLFR